MDDRDLKDRIVQVCLHTELLPRTEEQSKSTGSHNSLRALNNYLITIHQLHRRRQRVLGTWSKM